MFSQVDTPPQLPQNSQVWEWWPQMAGGVVIFAAFWIGGIVLQKIVVRLGKTKSVDRHLARFFGKSVRVTMVIVGAITALGTMGIDVAALVAGLGLTGFALGFALKDVVSNVLAGILIIIYKPFNNGDRIKVSSFEGTVTQIDLRYTQLDSDGAKILVPNSMLFTNAITVYASSEST